MDLHNPEKEKQLETEFDLKEKREEMIKQFPLMWLIELLIYYISKTETDENNKRGAATLLEVAIKRAAVRERDTYRKIQDRDERIP